MQQTLKSLHIVSASVTKHFLKLLYFLVVKIMTNLTAAQKTAQAQALAAQTAIIAKYAALANDQLFDCFGTSMQNEINCKVRFANNINKRTKVLVKNAHTQICLQSTINSIRVTKLQACALMLNSANFASVAQQNAVVKYIVNNCAQHLQALKVTQAQIAIAIA